MLFVCSVAWLFLLGCQYQCKWLTGKTGLRNHLWCVDGDVKPYSLTHSPRRYLRDVAWDLRCSPAVTAGLQPLRNIWHPIAPPETTSDRSILLRVYFTLESLSREVLSGANCDRYFIDHICFFLEVSDNDTLQRAINLPKNRQLNSKTFSHLLFLRMLHSVSYKHDRPLAENPF